MVLGSYAVGVISRSTAMKRLGLTWYGQLLESMEAAGLQVLTSNVRQKAMVAEIELVESRIVFPNAGPLITLAKLGLLDLLVFKEDIRIVLTDYVEFEVTRRRHEHVDAMRIHAFVVANAGRIEIHETSIGKSYEQLFAAKERLANDPELAEQLGVDLEMPEDPGEMSIIQYLRDLIARPPGTPVLVIAEDDYFLREVSPVPGNAHVVSTRAFVNALHRVANLKESPLGACRSCGSTQLLNFAHDGHPVSRLYWSGFARTCGAAVCIMVHNSTNIPRRKSYGSHLNRS